MKPLHVFLAAVGIAGLIAVRMLEDVLFYDPFLTYFHTADKNAEFPGFEWFPLIASYFFRFVLNLLFSALIVQNFFRNRRWTLQSVVLIFLIFLLTLPLYLYCIHTKFEIGYLFSFYMRRFVIQPLPVLLLLPLLYYRKRLTEL